MIDKLLAPLAPHYCSGCGIAGTLLCDNCKYDIIEDDFLLCVLCGNSVFERGLCAACSPHGERAWCVGERADSLRRLIDSYKFNNAKAAHFPIASLLDARIDQLPPNTIVVPVPTIPSHIRQRGYDHTLLVARTFAKLRQLQLDTSLVRVNRQRQRGATRKERFVQAKEAFQIRKSLHDNVPHLLIDDIVTTGATMLSASEALRGAGAAHVWLAVVARQPLDE